MSLSLACSREHGPPGCSWGRLLATQIRNAIERCSDSFPSWHLEPLETMSSPYGHRRQCSTCVLNSDEMLIPLAGGWPQRRPLLPTSCCVPTKCQLLESGCLPTAQLSKWVCELAPVPGWGSPHSRPQPQRGQALASSVHCTDQQRCCPNGLEVSSKIMNRQLCSEVA